MNPEVAVKNTVLLGVLKAVIATKFAVWQAASRAKNAMKVLVTFMAGPLEPVVSLARSINVAVIRMYVRRNLVFRKVKKISIFLITVAPAHVLTHLSNRMSTKIIALIPTSILSQHAEMQVPISVWKKDLMTST
jgi:hypothetical protein